MQGLQGLRVQLSSRALTWHVRGSGFNPQHQAGGKSLHSEMVTALDSVVCLPIGNLFRVMEKKMRHFISPLGTFKEEYKTFNRTLKGSYWLYLYLEYKASISLLLSLNLYTRKRWKEKLGKSRKHTVVLIKQSLNTRKCINKKTVAK